MSLTKKKVFY